MNFISELYQFVTRKRDENGTADDEFMRKTNQWKNGSIFYKSHDIREEVIPNSCPSYRIFDEFSMSNIFILFTLGSSSLES